MLFIGDQACKPGNEQLYRLLVFCGLTVYGGLRPKIALGLTWKDARVPQIFTLRDHEIQRVVFYSIYPKADVLIIDARLADIIYLSYNLALATLNKYNGEVSAYRNRYLMPNIKSNGMQPMQIQYVNRWLKEVALEFFPELSHISTLTLRKTYARRRFDMLGGDNKALIALSRELNHSSSSVTAAYIAL